MASVLPNAPIDSSVVDVLGDWTSTLAEEMSQPYFAALTRFVAEERLHHQIYPPLDDTFAALRFTPPQETRVVILGQDPYHGQGQANGLAFSVPLGATPPPSLRNIFREMSDDLECALPASGNLEPWARQGVLLLNTTLTVRAGEAASHTRRGWEIFTDRIVVTLGQRSDHCVFILWGRHATAKTALIAAHHTIISSAHPSPLSARNGFFGSRPFSRANAALMAHGQTPVDWAVIAGG